MDIYDDVDIYAHLRFKREGILRITGLIASDIQHETDRNGVLSPSLQVCVALRYFATGSMQNLVGDSIQIHKSTVCRVNRRVSLALCRHIKKLHACQALTDKIQTRQKFHAIAGFPDAIGCIDGTQIKIKAPTVDENAFVKRKGFHSQVICDPNVCFFFLNVSLDGLIQSTRALSWENQTSMTNLILVSIVAFCWVILHTHLKSGW